MCLQGTKSERNDCLSIKIETTNLSYGGVKHEFFIVQREPSPNLVLWTTEPVGMIIFHDGLHIFRSYWVGRREMDTTTHESLESAFEAMRAHGSRVIAGIEALQETRTDILLPEEIDFLSQETDRQWLGSRVTRN